MIHNAVYLRRNGRGVVVFLAAVILKYDSIREMDFVIFGKKNFVLYYYIDDCFRNRVKCP